MSGKHGAVPDAGGDTSKLCSYLVGREKKRKKTNHSAVSFSAQYTDYYISTKEGIAAFIGNRSVVIHKAGGGRVVCANITAVSSNVPSGPAVTAPAAPGSGSVFGISSVLALGSILAAAALTL